MVSCGLRQVNTNAERKSMCYKVPLYNIICLRVTPQEGFLLILTLVNWTA